MPVTEVAGGASSWPTNANNPTTGTITPASGELLVAIAVSGNGANAAATSVAMSGTGAMSGTWTLLGHLYLTTGPMAAIFVKDAGASPASGTATATFSSPSEGCGLQVRRFASAAPAASQTGVVVTGGSAGGGVMTLATGTSLTTGSQVVGAFADSSSSLTLTANGSTTIYNKSNGSSGDTECAFEASSLSTNGSSMTLGFTNSGSGQSTAMVLVEILPNLANSLTAGALNVSPVQLAGTLNNPVNVTAGALLVSPVQLAGTVTTADHVTAGNLGASVIQLAGTLNNPVNILSAALLASPVQLAGELGTNKAVSGNLLASAAQLAGTLTNPVNILSGSLPVTVRLGGSILSGNESLMINGQDIMSCARAFAADLSGMLAVPLVRTADIAVPGKQGLVQVARKLYDRAQIPMQIWVRGMNSDNTWPPPGHRDVQFYKNLDTLMQMFAVSGTVTLAHYLPDGTTREITGQVLQAMTPKRYAWSERSTGNLAVIIECVNPFWREPTTVTDSVTAPTTTPVTAQLAGQDGSTAPIEDAVVVFEGPCTNPRLTCGNWYVQYSDVIASGHSVSIDCGAWTVTGTGFTADYSKLVHAGLGPWITFAPAPPGSGGPSVTYAITAGGSSTCTVTAQRAFLGG